MLLIVDNALFTNFLTADDSSYFVFGRPVITNKKIFCGDFLTKHL